jgi:site-specific DNA recombinase
MALRNSKTRSKLVSNVKKMISRLIDAYGDGLLDKSEFEPRISAARERLAKLEAEYRQRIGETAQESELRLVIGQLEEFARCVSQSLQEPDWDTRREVVRALVKQVEIDKQEVRIVYRVSPFPFERGPQQGFSQHCWGRGHRTLRRPYFCLRPLAVLEYARSEPLLNQAEYPSVGDPVLEELLQPFVVDVVKEPTDVSIEHPVHLLPHESHPERVQRIMLAASGPKPIREAQEVDLVDLVKYPHHNLLDDLVLQGRDAQRSLSSVGLRDEDATRRLRPVGTFVDPAIEIAEPIFEASFVLLPPDAVDSWGRFVFEREKAFLKSLDGHVV